MPMRRKKTPKKRKSKLKTIQAGGGVLYKHASPQSMPEILLIRRNGIWDLPKGKKEEYESIEECAIREVAEETGIAPPHLRALLTQTIHEYEEDGELIEKETTWFSMEPAESSLHFHPQAEEGITDIEWVRADEALERVGYINLVEVIEKLLDDLQV